MLCDAVVCAVYICIFVCVAWHECGMSVSWSGHAWSGYGVIVVQMSAVSLAWWRRHEVDGVAMKGVAL